MPHLLLPVPVAALHRFGMSGFGFMTQRTVEYRSTALFEGQRWASTLYNPATWAVLRSAVIAQVCA